MTALTAGPALPKNCRARCQNAAAVSFFSSGQLLGVGQEGVVVNGVGNEGETAFRKKGNCTQIGA